MSDSKLLHSPALRCVTAPQCRATSDLIHALQETRLPPALFLLLLQACSPASPPPPINQNHAIQATQGTRNAADTSGYIDLGSEMKLAIVNNNFAE